jgi:predicted dithiol-disulfide oxidoreductase (DUF899 family)
MTDIPNIDTQIQELQQEIRARQQALAELRQQRPEETVADFELHHKTGQKVRLSELFGDQEELLLIHNMGKACVYCTMWADSFRGISEQINDRMAFALVSPDAPEVLREFADSRQWNFNCLSAHGTEFIKDMGYAVDKDGKTFYHPGVSALVKKPEGTLVRVAKDYFGPGDPYCAPWHFFSLFPKGDNGWAPKYSYQTAKQ